MWAKRVLAPHICNCRRWMRWNLGGAARAHLTSWATTYTKHHRCCGLGASSDIMNDSQKWCFVPDTLHTFFILASKVTSAISTLEQNITSGFLTVSHSYINHRYWDSILETFLQHLLLDSPNLIRSSTVPWTAAQTRNWSLAVLANSIISQLLSMKVECLAEIYSSQHVLDLYINQSRT